MDDVDAVQGQIARNMLASGDWVTARLDGIIYLEKSPLIYWLMAISYKVFGAYDWAARIPIALSSIGLAWLTAAFGRWAFGQMAGFYAGLVMATCIGLFLFTRILIPDVMLTFTIALAMWAFLRVLDEEEAHPRAWAYTLAASLGVGLLLKSLIALVFPLGAAILYLLITRQLFSAATWKRFYPWSSVAIMLLIAAPWHILATLAKSAHLCFYPAQRQRHVSRLSVVLLHQRTAAALSQPALSTRLRHRPAPLLLAISPDLAFSLECLLPRCPEVVVSSNRPGRAHPDAGPLLDRIPLAFLYLFHHSGVLLHALLPGAGLAAGISHGRRGKPHPLGNTSTYHHHCAGGDRWPLLS